MKKYVLVAIFGMILLSGCGKGDMKPVETFPHEFVENIEVEIKEIELKEIEVKPIEIVTFEDVTTTW